MMNRKFFWLTLLAILAVLLFPSLALAANYTISSAADMASLRNSVSFITTHEGDTFVLTANISLGDWTPIGIFGTNREFAGTFDGNGYQIEYNTSGFDVSSLFYFIGTNGTVKNLHVKASVSGSYVAGGIAGFNYGNIMNCSFEGSVFGAFRAGGLAGVTTTGSISNCFNIGAVSSDTQAGGITGEVFRGTMSNCYNAGTVNGPRAGGLTGFIYDSALDHSFWLYTSCPDAIGSIDSGNTITNMERFNGDGILYAPVSGQSTLLGALNSNTDIWAANAYRSDSPVFRTITASPSALNFGTFELYYTAPSSQTVTIVNSASHLITLDPLPTSPYFELGPLSTSTLAPGESAAFEVWPREGLGIGEYRHIIMANETEGPTAGFDLRFIVTGVNILSAGVGSITAPAAGAVPAGHGSLTALDASYTVTNLTWQNGDGTPATLVNGRFKADSAYQAVIELQSNAGYRFPPGGITPSVNAGTPQAGLASSMDWELNRLSFTVTFPDTQALDVTGILVKSQPCLSYVEGDSLNLGGASATLTFNDTSTLDVNFAQFEDKGITATPADGTLLTVAGHDGQRIALWVNGHEAYTDPLTVIAGTFTVLASPKSLDFGSMIEGYAAPAAQIVTILNMGNRDVTLITPTNANYEIEALDPLTVAPSGTARLSIQPKTGLAAGTYSESILFSTTSLTNDMINVTFTVHSAIYAVEADTHSLSFGSMIEGYASAPAAQIVTITNMGNRDVTLITPTNAYYEIEALDPLTVSPSATARFEVQPKTGLAAGTYIESILFSTTSLTNDMVNVTFTVHSAIYAVEADTHSLSFGSMIEGYASAPAAQIVTITNMGNRDVTLITPTNAYYEIEALDPLTVSPAATARFEVQPKAGLAAGSYSENILFSTTSLTSDSVTVTFTVQSASYAIEANPLLVSFQSTAQGEAPPAAQTITVTNTGNKPITLTQPTAVHYTVGSLSALELMPLDTAVFTLAPNTGLLEGSYTETITIEGTNGAAASVQASFSVTQALTYCIAASPATLSFDSLAEGYLQPEAKTITVTNTGNQSISLYQPTAAYYVIGTLSATALDPGDTAAFTIVPKPDLSAGSYSETVEILGSMGASDQVEVTFPCTEPNEVYEVTDGDGGTFQQDDPDPSSLTFTASGSTQNFTGLTINGQLVDEDDYDVYEGSTIIVLHQDFLNTLAPGTYTLRFHYTDGHVDAGFVVQDYMPATGDNNALYLYGTLALLCLIALGLLRKKLPRRI